MKIEANIITEFLDQLDEIVNGMVEMIHIGSDNPYHDLRDMQESQYREAVKVFKTMHLVEKVKMNKTELSYLRDAVNAQDKIDRLYKMKAQNMKITDEDVVTEYEQRAIFKARLYGWLKTEIRNVDLSAVSGGSLFVAIEDYIYDNREWKPYLESKNHYASCQMVIKDICAEIEEDRRKAPQKSLF